MNLIGNIFTILILIMSTVFLAVAIMVGASDRAWKEEVATLQTKLNSVNAQLKQIGGATEKKEKDLAAEKVARTLQVSYLQTESRRLNQLLEQTQDKLTKRIEITNTQLAQLDQAQARITEQDIALEGLKKSNRDQVDALAKQYERVRKLNAQLFEVRNQVASLAETRNKLTAQLAKFEKVKMKLGFDEEAPFDHIPPKIESVVAIVQPNGLFEVKIGLDDGVRVGHEMDIFRRKQFVGRARVVKTDDNHAVLKTIQGLMNSQVREGDYVSTKL